MKVCLIVFLASLFAFNLWAELPIDFHNRVKIDCPKLNINISKKIIVRFMTAENKIIPPCGEDEIKIFNNICGDSFKCTDAEAFYNDLKKRYRGNIIGQ